MNTITIYPIIELRRNIVNGLNARFKKRMVFTIMKEIAKPIVPI